MGIYDDFLNKFQPQDNTNSTDWTAKAAQREIDRRKMLAKQLQNWQAGGELQNFRSGYTAGGLTSPLATLAQIAVNVAGSKLSDSANKEQDSADKKAQQLFEEGLQAYKQANKPMTNEEVSAGAMDTIKKWEEADKQQAQQPSPARIEQMTDPNFVPPQPSEFVDAGTEKTTPAVPTSGPKGAPKGALTKARLAAADKMSSAPTMAEQGYGAPAPTPATTSPVPAAPITYHSGNQTTLPSTGAGGGRGGQGGPTAAQMADYERQQRIAAIPGIDAENLKRPNEIWAGMPGYVDGIDKIGQSQLTPSQIEALSGSKLNSQPATSTTTTPTPTQKPALSKSRAAKTATVQGAGGGRGVQGGPTVQELVDAGKATTVDTTTDTGPDPVIQWQKDYQEGLAKQAWDNSLQNVVDDRKQQTALYRAKLAASGEKGQKLLDTIDQGDMFQDAKANWVPYEGGIINVKTREVISKKGDDSSDVIALQPGGKLFNKKTGEEIASNNPGPSAADKKEEAKQAQAAQSKYDSAKQQLTQTNNAIANIDNFLASGRVNDAAGTLTNAMSALAGKAGIATATTAAREDIKRFMNFVIPVVMTNLAAINGGKGVGGMVNTPAEVKMHGGTLAQMADPSNFTAAQLRDNLMEVRRVLVEGQKYHQQVIAAGNGSSAQARSGGPQVAPDGSIPNFNTMGR